MYTLRKITKESIEINIYLGKEYTLVLEDSNIKEFDRIKKEDFKDLDLDAYGFVIKEDQEYAIPLFRDNYYYIVNVNGQTFANVSLK